MAAIALAIYAPSVLAAMHVWFSQRPVTWFWAFAIAPVIAPLLYLYVVLTRADGRHANGVPVMSEGAFRPVREFQEAGAAVRANPSRHNQMRMARAAEALGQTVVAEQAWKEAVQGIGAQDADALLGYARVLNRLERWTEALIYLEKWQSLGDAETPKVTLALAHAYEGLLRTEDAESAYRRALGRLPIAEAETSYVRFLAKIGRIEEAKALLADMQRGATDASHAEKGQWEARCRWAEFGIEAAEKAGPDA